MPDPTLGDNLRRRLLLGKGLVCAPVEPGLDVGRDLTVVGGPRGRDLATVDGMDNLTQCLAIAVTTVLGSDVFNTEFGFDGVNALVEETDKTLVRERVRVSIIRLLGRDPRIRRIVDLKLLDRRLEVPDIADDDASPAALLDRWRTVEVRVAFETVSGDPAVIDLGRVVPDA
jgi:phage baseplate assembly protein W